MQNVYAGDFKYMLEQGQGIIQFWEVKAAIGVCLAVIASWYDVAVTDIGFNANLVWIWFGSYGVDFGLGTWWAVKNFSTVWNWSKFKRGASRVVPLTLMFIFGLTLAYILNATIGMGDKFMNCWLGYMASIELLSILKNCDRLGWRLPYPLPEFTRWLHDKTHKRLNEMLKDKTDDENHPD